MDEIKRQARFDKEKAKKNLEDILEKLHSSADITALTGYKKLFKKEISQYLTPEMTPLGTKIIEACLNDAKVEDYYNFIPKL